MISGLSEPTMCMPSTRSLSASTMIFIIDLPSLPLIVPFMGLQE